MRTIKIQNAKIHNLKNIDVEIPRDKFTVVTGVSGSGKSSLIYDVLYKKARDLYLDAIGIRQHHYADVADSIKGLCPVVAVEQKVARATSSRSVVGTRTNIFEYLRQLYAAAGKRKCSKCGEELTGSNSCKNCGNSPEPFPKGYFSFNTLNGKCEVCGGRGYNWEPSFEKLTSNSDRPIKKAYWFWMFKPCLEKFHIIEKKFNITEDMSLNQLEDECRKAVLYGWGDFPGIIPHAASQVEYLMYKCPSAGPGMLERYYERRVCSACSGMRLGKGPLSVLLNGKSMGELSKMTLEELDSFLSKLKESYLATSFEAGLINSIQRQIEGFRCVNLSYLSLYRAIPTLSGGEIQRLYIMRHISSRLDSALFIFDEPTAGLHEIEKIKLIQNIKALSSGRNGLIIVEHDRNTIEMAEHIIDIGPLAGSCGGTVVYNGPVEGILKCEDSYTGRYLSGSLSIPSKTSVQYKKVTLETPKLKIRNACENNLKNIDVDIPLGMICGIAGVSGSGKSSMASKVLVPLLHRYFKEIDEIDSDTFDISEDEEENPEDEEIASLDNETSLSGIENITGFADVAQIPMSRYVTSTPLSYLGLWDRIRKIYSVQPEAINKELTMSHFSFNSSKGACPECKGRGVKKMGFNSPIYFECEVCNGKRFDNEVLEVQYKGLNIHQLQSLSIAEGVSFFKEDKIINEMLKMLDRTGLGYMKLGQPIPTLSGGEAQRLKIAKELGRKRKGSILYILDEPTTGLSFHDISNLLPLLEELVEAGNSVLVIEHDPDVLTFCDFIIELGPGAGTDGGQVIAKGSPCELRCNPQSIIGKYLKIDM